MDASVSVIVPFYNNLQWLTEAVDSVLAQTYKVKEIIIINDGSNEDMTAFLLKYQDEIMYITKDNGGPASARNIGIDCSTGDYVAFLDSDDIWLPSKIEKQLNEMIKSGAVWSHTAYETFDDQSQYDESKNTIKDIKQLNGNIYPRVVISCCIATPCVMIKGDMLRENRELRFNSLVRFGEDTYLWTNLSVRYNILGINEVLTRVRIRGTNAALNARVQIESKYNTWKYMRLNEGIFNTKKFPFIIKMAFYINSTGKKLLDILKNYINNEKILEWCSKFIYIYPWVLFKSYAILRK